MSITQRRFDVSANIEQSFNPTLHFLPFIVSFQSIVILLISRNKEIALDSDSFNFFINVGFND